MRFSPHVQVSRDNDFILLCYHGITVTRSKHTRHRAPTHGMQSKELQIRKFRCRLYRCRRYILCGDLPKPVRMICSVTVNFAGLNPIRKQITYPARCPYTIILQPSSVFPKKILEIQCKSISGRRTRVLRNSQLPASEYCSAV